MYRSATLLTLALNCCGPLFGQDAPPVAPAENTYTIRNFDVAPVTAGDGAPKRVLVEQSILVELARHDPEAEVYFLPDEDELFVNATPSGHQRIERLIAEMTAREPSERIRAEMLYLDLQRTRDGIGRYFFGREIAQVMGHLGANWLERPSREKEERTSLLVKLLEVEEGMDVADIGAGTGYFSSIVSEITGDALGCMMMRSTYLQKIK